MNPSPPAKPLLSLYHYYYYRYQIHQVKSSQNAEAAAELFVRKVEEIFEGVRVQRSVVECKNCIIQL